MMIVDKDFLVDLRRNAYIECTENYLSSNTVLGIFGDDLPLDLFYACNLMPIPMEGVDSHIFKFGKEGEWSGYCDVIKSTLIYLTTQKCPILYSCKMYVLQNKCKRFIDTLKSQTEKPVLVYNNELGNENELISSLCKVYGKQYDESLRQDAKADLNYIQNVLQQAKSSPRITCQEFFLLEFYTQYMTNLKMRREYFEKLEKKLSLDAQDNTTKEQKEKAYIHEITAFCPRGCYEHICTEKDVQHNLECPKKEGCIRIKRTWDHAMYGYEHCPFSSEKKVSY